MTEQSVKHSGKSRIFVPVLPLVFFLVIGVFLGIGLFLDPSLIPSPLIGKDVPEFKLPPVKGRKLGLESADLRKGEVSIVNVFASWCVSCLEEHPLLMRLGKLDTVQLHGLNYKDKPDAAAGWRKKYGDPYKRIGADIKGLVDIDWGVYGVPETFVIDKQGKIAYKVIGPVNEKILKETLLPLIEKLNKAPDEKISEAEVKSGT